MGWLWQTTRCLLLSLIASAFLLSASAERQVVVSTVQTGIAAGFYATPYSYMRHTFEALGRQWVFYANNGQKFKSSTDSANWTSEQTGCPVSSISFSYWTNSTHVFGVTNYGSQIFILGTLYSNGSISWGTVRDVSSIFNSNPWYSYVTVDTQGYPWIIGSNGSVGVAQDLIVTKANNKNGTSWGSPWKLSSFTPQRYSGIVLPFSNGDMYAIFKAYDSPIQARDKAFGRYFTRGTSTWEPVENITAQFSGTSSYTVVIDSSDKVWLAYYNITGSGLWIASRTRTGSWTTPTALYGGGLATENPQLSAYGNGICLTWINSTGYRMMQRLYQDGAWQDEYQFTTVSNYHATQTSSSTSYSKGSQGVSVMWGEYSTTTTVKFGSFVEFTTERIPMIAPALPMIWAAIGIWGIAFVVIMGVAFIGGIQSMSFSDFLAAVILSVGILIALLVTLFIVSGFILL